METKYDYNGLTLKVSLSGELDESVASAVRSSLDENIAHGAKKVIIDMSKLSFMDSTGIGVLVGRYKKFSGKEVAFFISNPSVTVDKILKLSGVYGIMTKIERA